MYDLTFNDCLNSFPFETPTDVQIQIMKDMIASENGIIVQAPPGIGKTAANVAVLKTLSLRGIGPLFYVTPSKTQVDQVAELLGSDARVIVGRAEYPCFYFDGDVNAQDSPCQMLDDCGHRVNQEDGNVHTPGCEACPYQQAKRNARLTQGQIIVCTTAFYIMNRLLVPHWKDMKPALVVLDEAHQVAKVTRGLFEHHITDAHLNRCIKVLKPISKSAHGQLQAFKKVFLAVAKEHPARSQQSLNEKEIGRLVDALEKINPNELEKSVKQAIRGGKLNPIEDLKLLKMIESIIRGIPRMLTSLQYAMETDGRKPLSYVVAFYYKEHDAEYTDTPRRARFRLTVRSYYVKPIIKKVMGGTIVPCSATIGNPRLFGYETGIVQPFKAYDSTFPVGNRRIYIPRNAQNLSFRKRSKDAIPTTLKLIVKAAKKFAQQGLRSLVVVVSEKERQMFYMRAKKAGLNILTYGGDEHAKDVAQRFKSGEGDVLLGTTAHYSEGLDLPHGTCPIIFFLRPSHANPKDPQSIFELKRFGRSDYFRMQRHRAQIQAQQMPGRNIRNETDKGVCFFMSMQFRDFLFSSLTPRLQTCYRSDLKLHEAISDALMLLDESKEDSSIAAA